MGWYDGHSREETKDMLRYGDFSEGSSGIKVGFPGPVRIRDRHEVDL